MNIENLGTYIKIIKPIGKGAFSEVFLAINTRLNKEAAIKIDETDSRQLYNEFSIYNLLHSDISVIDKGIPNVYYHNTEGSSSFM
jgi:casein kinase 1